MLKTRYSIPSLLIISLSSLLWAISHGSYHLAHDEIIKALLKHPHNLTADIIWQLRLPRAINAFTTGGLLAIAGALMQVLLRNPLADPYVLGISGGAAVFNLLGTLVGISAKFSPLLAMCGAILSMLLVFNLSRTQRFTDDLLLTGIVVAAAWSALISFILTISPDKQLHSMLFWLMGDLGQSQLSWLGSLILLFALLYSLLLAPKLNILQRGQLIAQSLGVNAKQLQLEIYFLSACLTAVAVSSAGCIGFVGLIVPHLLRLSVGSDHRILLPSCLLLGGSLLCFTDTLAQSLLAPRQLPIGIVMALIGIPIFLYLLKRHTP